MSAGLSTVAVRVIPCLDVDAGIVGKALYAGAFTLPQALAEVAAR
jgi:imidazole glycerol phosphate synthase subunit HisF